MIQSFYHLQQCLNQIARKRSWTLQTHNLKCLNLPLEEKHSLQELVDEIFFDTKVVDEGIGAEPPTGPRCEVFIDYVEVEKEDGETFCYWRCQKQIIDVKCFVTHSNDEDF